MGDPADTQILPVVYHVGRAGDVPGGMTQVVNAYLEWPFTRSRVEVIASRGDPHDHVRALGLFLSALRQVRRIARARRPAVIVVHVSERGSFVREGCIARYARRLGLPVVAHLHGSEFAEFEAAHSRLVGAVLAASDTVITLSEETSRICARHVSADRIHLVPNAVPEGTPQPKSRTVVFGGVVGVRKGVDVLMEAWRTLPPPEGWELLIAGPVPDPTIVAGSTPGIRVCGPVSHEELMRMLDRASVAVLPSRDEAMPMFLLEAMARRAAIVTTDVGGIPALIGDAGVLVPAGDAAALRVALGRLLGDDGERQRLSQAAWDRFEASFSAGVVFPRVEDLWLSAARDASA